VQVGDLVKHKKTGFVGLIVDCFEEGRPDARLDSYIMWRIHWFNGAKGSCWGGEFEVVSETG